MAIYKGQEHRFGEYITDIDYSDKILKEASKKEVVEGLKSYLVDRARFKGKPYGRHKKVAEKKAEQILGLWSPRVRGNVRNIGDKIEKEYYPENLSKETAVKRKKFLIDAVDKGYIENFCLQAPWHINVYNSEDQPDTFPFQHDSVIAYSQRGIHEFYSAEYCDQLVKQERFYNPEDPESSKYFRHRSVFVAEGWKAGNTHQNKTGSTGTAVTGTGTRVWGIYTSPKVSGGHAQNSTRPVIVELQLPSESIVINQESDYQGYQVEDLKQCIEKYGEPENYDLSDSFVVKPSKRPRKDYAVPLNWVTGINDPRYMDDETFISVGAFWELLSHKEPEKVPEKFGDYSKSLKKEVIALEEAKNILYNHEKRGGYLKNTIDMLAAYKKTDEVGTKDFIGEQPERYFELLEKYEKYVSNVEDILQQFLDGEVSRDHSIRTFQELEDYEFNEGWMNLVRGSDRTPYLQIEEVFQEALNEAYILYDQGKVNSITENSRTRNLLEKAKSEIEQLPRIDLDQNQRAIKKEKIRLLYSQNKKLELTEYALENLENEDPEEFLRACDHIIDRQPTQERLSISDPNKLADKLRNVAEMQLEIIEETLQCRTKEQVKRMEKRFNEVQRAFHELGREISSGKY